MNKDLIYITQGEDADCELEILKSDGTALDMSSAPRIYVIIYDGYGNVMVKFKKGSAAGGWVIMDTSLESTGKLLFHVLSTITLDMKPGHYYAEVRIRYNSSVHTDDNFFDVPKAKEYLFTVKESQIAKLGTLPA